MNKANLIKTVAEKANFKQKDVELILNTITDTIKSELVNGGIVKIHTFGKFEVRQRAARKGRNPQTGKKMKLPASKRPAFTPSVKLRQAVKGK